MMHFHIYPAAPIVAHLSSSNLPVVPLNFSLRLKFAANLGSNLPQILVDLAADLGSNLPQVLGQTCRRYRVKLAADVGSNLPQMLGQTCQRMFTCRPEDAAGTLLRQQQQQGRWQQQLRQLDSPNKGCIGLYQAARGILCRPHHRALTGLSRCTWTVVDKEYRSSSGHMRMCISMCIKATAGKDACSANHQRLHSPHGAVGTARRSAQPCV
jgi:hypothetical protein